MVEVSVGKERKGRGGKQTIRRARPRRGGIYNTWIRNQIHWHTSGGVGTGICYHGIILPVEVDKPDAEELRGEGGEEWENSCTRHS